MRRFLAVLCLASAAAAPGALAAQTLTATTTPPPATQTPVTQTPPPPDPLLVYYPGAARTAGVEGAATINCTRDTHLTLTDCKLVSEKPAGQGFGQAALAMAARSTPNLKVTTNDPKLRAAADIEVDFGLHPPVISPDLTKPAHMVTSASLVTGPTLAQIQAVYPVRAADDQVEGAAVLGCFVDKAGKLFACTVMGEQPSGYGFGQAALDLVGDFVINPQKLDGEPLERSEVRVPVRFQRDPTAPLTLQTGPPGGQGADGGGDSRGGR